MISHVKVSILNVDPLCYQVSVAVLARSFIFAFMISSFSKCRCACLAQFINLDYVVMDYGSGTVSR